MHLYRNYQKLEKKSSRKFKKKIIMIENSIYLHKQYYYS